MFTFFFLLFFNANIIVSKREWERQTKQKQHRIFACLVPVEINSPLLVLLMHTSPFYESGVWCAGVCAVLVILLTGHQVRAHLRATTHAHLHGLVIRILFMPGIYAVYAWLAMRFHPAAPYLDLIRDCYEALVIYSFYKFLMGCLGGPHTLHGQLIGRASFKHSFPFCCLAAWTMPKFGYLLDSSSTESSMCAGSTLLQPQVATDEHKNRPNPSLEPNLSLEPNASLEPNHPWHAGDFDREINRGLGFVGTFLLHTQFGTLQYVFVKTLCSGLMLICTLSGKAGEEPNQTESESHPFIQWDRADIYLGILTNMSQIWAMFCLVVFYIVCKQDLQPIRPLFKFAMVKAVVFMTFWQSLALLLLAKLHLLWPPDASFSDTDVLSVVSNFLLCFEMLLASCAHLWAFPPHENYIIGQRPSQTITLLAVTPTSFVESLPVQSRIPASAERRGTAKTEIRSLLSVFNISDIRQDASQLRRHALGL